MELTNLKIKLELVNDTTKDDLLTILLSDAINLINLYLGTSILPTELNFIAEELTIKRFRKVGVESTKTEKIDVLQTEYTADDLSEYIPLLDNYKINTLNKNPNKNKLRTL